MNPLPPPNNAFRGAEDAFVSKLKFDNLTSTPSLIYSTYLSGSNAFAGDEGHGIAVDASGNAYVTGHTGSTDFPIMNPLPAPNNALQGGADAFVSKLSFNSLTSTLSLAYSTFLGGTGIDQGFGVAVDARGNAYVTGYTESFDFPTVYPLSAPNNRNQGNDAFVAKLVLPVPFAAFSTKLKIVAKPQPSFDMTGSFTLAANSTGINPLVQRVTLQIGTFSVTIPEGSFKQQPNRSFMFQGVINGVSFQVQIVPLGKNSFSIKAHGTGVNLTGLTNPVTMALTIGNDSGSTTVTAQFK